MIYNEYGITVTPDDMDCHDFATAAARRHSFNTCCDRFVSFKYFKKLDIISFGYNVVYPNGREFVTHLNHDQTMQIGM